MRAASGDQASEPVASRVDASSRSPMPLTGITKTAWSASAPAGSARKAISFPAGDHLGLVGAEYPMEEIVVVAPFATCTITRESPRTTTTSAPFGDQLASDA